MLKRELPLYEGMRGQRPSGGGEFLEAVVRAEDGDLAVAVVRILDWLVALNSGMPQAVVGVFASAELRGRAEISAAAGKKKCRGMTCKNH